MSVGSVAIKEKNGSDLHSAQKIHQKWIIGPIWTILSYDALKDQVEFGVPAHIWYISFLCYHLN